MWLLFFIPFLSWICSVEAVTYGYTGSQQIVTLPAGTYAIDVDMAGAAGGSTGGKGARVQVTLFYPGGTVFNLFVGGVGGTTAGGYNGGGNGYAGVYSPGGGGGASDIRIGGVALSNRVVIAGGGGGGTPCVSRVGGNAGQTGTAGQNSVASGGIGGDTISHIFKVLYLWFPFYRIRRIANCWRNGKRRNSGIIGTRGQWRCVQWRRRRWWLLWWWGRRRLCCWRRWLQLLECGQSDVHHGLPDRQRLRLAHFPHDRFPHGTAVVRAVLPPLWTAQFGPVCTNIAAFAATFWPAHSSPQHAADRTAVDPPDPTARRRALRLSHWPTF